MSGSVHKPALASLGTLNSANAVAPPLRHVAPHQYDPVPYLSTRKCCRALSVRMPVPVSRHTDDSIRHGRADAVSRVTVRPRPARGRRPAERGRAHRAGPGPRGSPHLDHDGARRRAGRPECGGSPTDELRRTRRRRRAALCHPALLPGGARAAPPPVRHRGPEPPLSLRLQLEPATSITTPSGTPAGPAGPLLPGRRRVHPVERRDLGRAGAPAPYPPACRLRPRGPGGRYHAGLARLARPAAFRAAHRRGSCGRISGAGHRSLPIPRSGRPT